MAPGADSCLIRRLGHDHAIVVRDERVARAWKHTPGLGSDPSRPVLVNHGIV